jgi:hypothetical protein
VIKNERGDRKKVYIEFVPLVFILREFAVPHVETVILFYVMKVSKIDNNRPKMGKSKHPIKIKKKVRRKIGNLARG